MEQQFQLPEELRQEINAEIDHEAQRLALIRELKEKGEFHTVQLSDVRPVTLGSKLWFDKTEGGKAMVQVLEIDYEAKTVGVRALSDSEAAKVEASAKGGNRKARRKALKGGKRGG